jgi:hypothetical protein
MSQDSNGLSLEGRFGTPAVSTGRSGPRHRSDVAGYPYSTQPATPPDGVAILIQRSSKRISDRNLPLLIGFDRASA